MKIELKKPQLKKKKAPADTEPSVNANFAAAGFSAGGFDVAGYGKDSSEASFEVDVRNADASVKILDEEGGKWIKKLLTPEIIPEIGTGLALMSLPALLLAAAYMPATIPFTLVGVVVYLILTSLGNLETERIKYITAAVLFVSLVVLMIVFRKYLLGGIGIVMNQVYAESESAQAYIYNKFTIPSAAEGRPELCVRLAVVWVSVMLGVLASIPPAFVRRIIGVAAVCASMIAFAYYGILPSVVCLVIMAAALIMLLAGGSILSAVPVLLASLLIFGAVMMISPGESYGISRMDENFRDRFALRSAYLETSETLENNNQSTEDFEDIDQTENTERDFNIENKGVTGLIIGIIVLLAVAAAAYLMYSRYKKRRDKNRLGLDNPDPKKAITAMFPYGVKWLGAGDIDVSGKAFEKLIPVVEHSISPEYAENYKGMYALWQEAAYSDHPMDEDGRTSMQSFIDETKKAISSEFNFKDKIVAALKYAL